MRLVRYSKANTDYRLGITNGRAVRDISTIDGVSATTMIDIITDWEKVSTALKDVVDFNIPLSDVQLHAPIACPGKILGIGLNYAEHAEEGGAALPEDQMWFSKPATTVNGPYDPIKLPLASDQLDYEVELVAVIGKRCRHLGRAAAQDAIFGYCIGNDVSVRDWQLKTTQVFLGKSFDTHAPFGPWITTADAFDPTDAALSCHVNGEQRQRSRTSKMVFDCADQVAHLSQVMTLEPGDIIFTGTPSGVGALMTPPAWLVEGDRVRCEIEGLGMIENVVEAEVKGDTVATAAGRRH
ncbi:MAG: fumarylacetoacetate hydrolase family protein [Pseudomonadota bacterium]